MSDGAYMQTGSRVSSMKPPSGASATGPAERAARWLPLEPQSSAAYARDIELAA